jgi:hypothetical protein
VNNTFEQTPKGWQCPVCGRVHAPFVAGCDCHLQRKQQTASTKGLQIDWATPPRINWVEPLPITTAPPYANETHTIGDDTRRWLIWY